MTANSSLQNFDDYILPSSEFLTAPRSHIEQTEEDLLTTAQELTDKLREFNVAGRVMHIAQGPVVTTYEYKLDPGIKFSRLAGLSDDLCIALKAESIHIDRIPGKAFVGIEIPNRQRETIYLREVIESKKFASESDSLLTIALGKKIDGMNYIADLAEMPHLLISGTTGTGKSVAVNTLIASLLYKAKPDELKFIMIDPKRLELGLYADIPHLATPVICESRRALLALKWAVSEMEKRYKDLAGWGVRNIDGFNEEVRKRNAEGTLDEYGNQYRILPYIVVIIDEFADLMMTSGKETEEAIIRLAQMARAVGIHLVLATQKPSSDVISGLIKANFSCRIAFRVPAKVDSRTILDANGAETLLGRGDMLFLPPNTPQAVRIHGAFINEKEIYKIVEHVKAQGKPEYDTTITKTEEEMDDGGDLPGRTDQLFWDAVKTVVTAKKASTSLLQRHLRIGYGRAAAILDAMVKEGYIGDQDGSSRDRPILQKAYDNLQDMEENDSNLLQKIEKKGDIENKKVYDEHITKDKFEDITKQNSLLEQEQKNKFRNYGFNLFAVFSIISFVVSCGSCLNFLSESTSRPPSSDTSVSDSTALSAIIFIIGIPATFSLLFIANLLKVRDESRSDSIYLPSSKPLKIRSPNFFKKSRKSSIRKTIKREIRKYGD